MKVCKKIILIAIMIILLNTLNVYAGKVEVTTKVSSSEVKAGDTVTVTVSAKVATGVEGVDSTLEYDKTKLQLTNESALAINKYQSMSGTNEKTGEYKLSLLYSSSDAAPTEASFATLNFKVLDTVTVNEKLDIKLSAIRVIDSQDNSLKLDDVVTTLTVVENSTCKHTSEVTKEGRTPTCEQTGLTEEKSCKECGMILQQQTTKPALGHDYKNGKCTRCGKEGIGDYPYAGIEDYAFIVLGLGIVAILGYRKVKEYSDIK